MKGTQAAPLDPKLGALAYNGGYTKTHMPQNSSPVRDAGDSSGATVTDQRGYARVAGAAIDIGSVETRSRRIGPEIDEHDRFFMFGDFDEEDWLKKILSHFGQSTQHD